MENHPKDDKQTPAQSGSSAPSHQVSSSPNQQGLSWTHFAPASTTPAAVIPQKPASTPPPAAPRMPSVAQYVGIFAGGIMMGVLLAWGYTAATERSITASQNATSTPQSAQNTQSNSLGGGVVIGTDGTAQASFDVISPQSAGKTVTVAKVLVTQPTWVVVYENVDGATGRALGAALFSAQKQSGIVTLLRATVAGKSYFAGQLLDNGNKTFSLKTDTPVMSGDKQLLVEFTAQ